MAEVGDPFLLFRGGEIAVKDGFFGGGVGVIALYKVYICILYSGL